MQDLPTPNNQNEAPVSYAQPTYFYRDVAVTVPRGSQLAAAMMLEDQHFLVYTNYLVPEVLDNIKEVRYNGLVANLLDVEYIGDMPNLILGVTDFRLHSASINNPAAGERAEVIGEGLPKGLINTARITDRDGMEVLSLRNTDGLIGTIGGMFSPIENIQAFGEEHAFNPYAAIVLELWEEMGMWTELWCQQTDQWEYLLRKVETAEDLIHNIKALDRILNDFEIKISSVLHRGSPLNVPLIIFDIKLNNSFLELFQLHIANRNNELLQLMSFNPQELMPWQSIQKTSPALQMAYPDHFPRTGDYEVVNLMQLPTPPMADTGSSEVEESEA